MSKLRLVRGVASLPHELITGREMEERRHLLLARILTPAARERSMSASIDVSSSANSGQFHALRW